MESLLTRAQRLEIVAKDDPSDPERYDLFRDSLRREIQARSALVAMLFECRARGLPPPSLLAADFCGPVASWNGRTELFRLDCDDLGGSGWGIGRHDADGDEVEYRFVSTVAAGLDALAAWLAGGQAT